MSSPLLDFLSTNIWALHRPVFEALVGVVDRHVSGQIVPQHDVDAIVAAREAQRESTDLPRPYSRVGSVGVVPVQGVIARHASQVNGASQPRGASVEAIRAGFEAAAADPAVGSILLAIDSPGGTVSGVDELAAEIRASAKPVYAHGEGMMASAAYWLGSQASKVFATRSTAVGSIGVVSTVVDKHRAMANSGVDVHYLTSAPAKLAGAPGKAHTAGDHSELQREVDAIHELFIDAVATGRRIDRAQAEILGDGRVHMGRDAKARGLVDDVKSFQTVLAEMEAAHGGALRSENNERGQRFMDSQQAPQQQAVATAGGPTATAPVVPLISASLQQIEQAHPAHVATLLAQGAKNERARIAEIRALAAVGQEALAERMIAEGRTPDEAARAFAIDHKETGTARLSAMRADSAPVGPVVTEPATSNQDPEAAWRRIWDANANVRAAFGDFETFAMDRRAVADGIYPDSLPQLTNGAR